MANTLYLQVVLQMLEDGTDAKQLKFIQGPREIVLAGSSEESSRKTVSTTAAALPVPSGTIGLGIVHNLDSTNYIQLGWDDAGFVPSDKIPAGEFCIKWFDPSHTWQWKANTASCDVRIAIYPV